MIVSALLLAVAAPPPNEYFQVYNYPAVDSCAKWTEYRSSKTNQALEAWVLGFLTGANAYRPGVVDVANGTPSAGLLGWIDIYCASNPLDSVTVATFKLVKELDTRNKR